MPEAAGDPRRAELPPPDEIGRAAAPQKRLRSAWHLVDASRRSCPSSSTPKPISTPRSRGSSRPIRVSATCCPRRAAAAAPAAGRIRRARLDRGVAAALDRQRQGDLGTADRGLDPLDHGRCARGRQACARRPVGAEDPHPEGDRQRSTAARSIFRAARKPADEGARGADRAARHRALDRRHLSPVLPRPCRRLAGRRPRACRRRRASRSALPRPTTKEMGPLAEPWRPWRGVAARLLWTYYRASPSSARAAPIAAAAHRAEAKT